MDFAAFAKAFKALFPPGPIYNGPSNELKTRSEKRIQQMSGAIRAKPDWISKLGDHEIRMRWTQEAKQQQLTEQEIDYVFDELVHYVALHVPGSGIYLSPVERVWMSDSLVDEATTAELKRYAAILEDVPDRLKDWHPNSNDQVLNLVHPSLYPVVYKTTPLLSEPIASPAAALKVRTFGTVPGSLKSWKAAANKLASGGKGESEDAYYVPNSSISYASEKFCWLPSEFRVAEDGSVAIESYINNLHPVKHAALYPTIAAIFGRFVPVLEHVLTDLIYPRPRRVVPDSSNWFINDESEPDDYDASDYDERYEQWRDNRTFVDPQPDAFVAPERQTVPISLRGRRLQAIVKMSNIELTPDKPEYEGGNWHVEAMANERIVATGIYYYDVENITESTLSFRESVEEFYDYEQNDNEGVRRAYDIYDEHDDDTVPLVQRIGSVEAKNGRCIVFPNIYQHQVSGFGLADPTKPGHRKILAFFFIDPTVRIPSTEIVPPQQQDWWADTAKGALEALHLPDLVMDSIIKNVDSPMSLERAKELRLELMAERSTNNSSVDEASFAPPFFLCEH
ncbi:hypothetical protein H4R18_004385 [Coemansia javaensis]|uniref:DUF4246 domain-containing protein n=1 Tax=Coemansia javaensis TaxID=2761396 RepID=A0A9W8H974_9FUNG|nr:hypothetical protein H4R18_004385 [Coemansia javaensis]